MPVLRKKPPEIPVTIHPDVRLSRCSVCSCMTERTCFRDLTRGSESHMCLAALCPRPECRKDHGIDVHADPKVGK